MDLRAGAANPWGWKSGTRCYDTLCCGRGAHVKSGITFWRLARTMPTAAHKMALIVLVTTLAFSASPTASAQLSGLVFGSEDEPELWGDDTVSYDPVYPGGRDHDYLAINRSWLAVDAEEIHLVAHLRVVSTERLEANRQGGTIMCSLDAILSSPADSNVKPGSIHWGVSSNPTTSGIQGSAYFRFENGEFQEIQEIDSTFETVIGEPGYYVWSVSRATVMTFASHLTNLTASCVENVAHVTPFFNRDEATSKSNFSLEENRRVAAPDGALDPVERFERENGTAVPPSQTITEVDSGAPAPGAVALLFVVAIVAFVTRRR